MRSLEIAALGAAALLAACASSAPAPSPAAPPAPAASTALPPIAPVSGPLKLSVVYPPSEHMIESRDSEFVFGSVGNGKATLTINGTPVPVAPNGAFLAFLALPPATAPHFDLVATAGTDTASLQYPIKLSPPIVKFAPVGPLAFDTASVTPAPGARLSLRDDEFVRVSVRAPSNATVIWEGDQGAVLTLLSGVPAPGAHLFGGAGAITTYKPGGDPEVYTADIQARQLRARTDILITRGSDSLRVPLGNVAPAPNAGTLVILGSDTSAYGDSDRTVIARPVPAGTYKWFLLPGTIVPLTGWSGDFARVRLDSELEVWVSASEARYLPPGSAAPRRLAFASRILPAAEWSDLVIPMTARPPLIVEEGPRELVLTLYDTQITTDLIRYAENDSLLRLVQWMPLTSDRGKFTVRLAAPPYGYLVFWDRGQSALVLRVRRTPVIDASAPLRGLTIAIDPGHPPIGATGPTGLYEPVPTLAIGLQVKQMLEAEGATVFMTRTTADPVALNDRPVMARRANAHALVSIHLNALPDGVNPFISNGTGAYYFQPQSIPLARALQAGMVRHMGLRNLGINYDNLALARPTWMPAVLCEGAFLMLPEQENALRTPQFQAAYARGVVDGLEEYFRTLAPLR